MHAFKIKTIVAATVCSILSAAAFAQEEQTLKKISVQAEEESLATVVVENGALGQKSLLDTPFSVTVVDTNEVFKYQAKSVAQIFINDPGVFSPSIAGMTNWWGAKVRGLDVRNYYVDGVPLLLEWGGELPFEGMQSVEALKGLTGFMYGFGMPGGVLSYKTKKPTDERLLEATLTYRNDSDFAGHLDAGGRLGADNGFGYRVNLAGESGDVYTTAGVNRSIASLAVDYRFTDNLQWYASGMYEESKLKHEPFYFYFDGYTDPELPEPTYDYENVTVENSYYQTETLLGSTGFKWLINDSWHATISTGYSSKEHLSNRMFGTILNQAGDYEGSAYNFAGLLKAYFSQAILEGEFNTGAVRHQIVAGAAYQRKTEQWGNEWYWSNDFNGNLYERQPFLVTRDIDFSLAPLEFDERQSSLFASDTLHFGEKWQAIIGARFTDYESLDVDYDDSTDSGYATDAITPTYALIFKPIEYVSVYASFVESLEPGSRVSYEPNSSGDLYANAGALLGATVSNQYEIGAKFAHDKLSFTAAAFRVERAAEVDEYRGGLLFLVQDGVTIYQGVEFSTSYRVTENLTAGLGALYLDAGFEDVSAGNEEREELVPSGATEWQVVANVDYQISNGVSVFGNVRYYGDAYYDDMNTILIPDRTLVNVGFQYMTTLADHPLSVVGSVNNVFNKKYWEINTLGESINGSLSVRLSW